MVTDEQCAYVKATVPALREFGESITRAFYRRLFETHPELWNVFNPANQRDGGQARSLSAAVIAYAENIDTPERLAPMLKRITEKHCSLEVQPEHYPIVGKHLLDAVKEILGDAATLEILDAWGAAYGQLADMMIGKEATLYETCRVQAGGWEGFKPFRVVRKVVESEVITSFYLQPVDDLTLPTYKPGQYVSVRVQVPTSRYSQIRQYSLSSAPNTETWRISVRREAAPTDAPGAPEGLVSNYLHSDIQEGHTLEIHAPLGDFVLDDGSDPVVLLSGGSGITAVLSMLEYLTNTATKPRRVSFIHATRSRSHHAFGAHVRALIASRHDLSTKIVYETVTEDDVCGIHHDEIGVVTAELLRRSVPVDTAQYYYCGPVGFITAIEVALDELHVPHARRHSEAFAPDPSFILAEGSQLA